MGWSLELIFKIMDKKIRLVDSYSEPEIRAQEAGAKFDLLSREVGKLIKKVDSLNIQIALKQDTPDLIQKVLAMKAKLIELEALIEQKTSELRGLLVIMDRATDDHSFQQDILTGYRHKGKPS